MAVHNVVTPSLGNADGEAILSSWLVNIGDKVTLNSPVALVETNKAQIEIEAGFEGWVKAFLIPVGSELTDFQAILEISSDQP